LQTIKYDDIQQIIKVTRLNTNASGQVGDSFIQNAIDGGNATDFAFDEIKGKLKKLKTQKVNPVDNLGSTIDFRDQNLPFASLSGLTNPLQSANLLADIASSFGGISDQANSIDKAAIGLSYSE